MSILAQIYGEFGNYHKNYFEMFLGNIFCYFFLTFLFPLVEKTSINYFFFKKIISTFAYTLHENDLR